MTFVLVESAHDRDAVGRRIVGWLAVAVVGGGVLIAQLGRIGAPVMESPPASTGGHLLVVPGNGGGSCYVTASVNGSPFHMEIDTGASGHLTFGRNHLAQLGYDASKLSFTDSYGSANGTGHEANIRVREFRLGSFVMRDVPAAITDATQSDVLLGIELLHRLHLRLSGGNCELTLP